ncbi:ABC transporter ATP-binding protein [Paenibacillus sp. YPG26]|uniref:ABC transporter ATP-binding protein n=1 Tax=Paenibacillus sp. YPG26 TaxID=2878915 RepID=UPI0020421630|nr:ABC transporter ATP-binding protein [Paenibacillus sp. YPG26]USB33580.1 ABC transporter ATP-binding protein [Paenibacillus sp. YPG26]
MTVILKATGISKKYKALTNSAVISHCSIEIEKGKTYVIKGKSGSGKTTLLNILGGIDKPSSGSVYYQGRSFYELSDNEQSRIRNEDFGFIFQSLNLIPELTVYENIELPRFFNRSCKISGSDISNIASEIGIGSLLHRKTYQLSGGEQQRVAIARALITSPNIIFADEPTGSLDASTSKIIAELLTRTVKIREVALVLVTHEEKIIEEDHIELTINDGKIETLEEYHGQFGS